MDGEQRTLRRDGAPFHLSPQQLQMLSELLPHAGQTVSRQTLIDTVWNRRAITDYAMDKAVSRLRAALGCEDDGPFDIVADKGRGFHFRGHIVWADTPDGVVPAERGAAPRVANAGGVPASAEEQAIVLDRLLDPHRAFITGRAALESLSAGQIAAAAQAFRDVLALDDRAARAHIGLATALVFEFESTRSQLFPNHQLLVTAEHHAVRGRDLDPECPEAWGALALVYHRRGRRLDAMASARQAIACEKGAGSIYGHLHLAFVSSGDERLRAGSVVIDRLANNGIAHWFVSTVYIARSDMARATTHIDKGCTAQESQRAQRGAVGRMALVGSYFQRGLVLAAQQQDGLAEAAFAHELTFSDCGHFLAPEVSANTWYARGGVAWRGGDLAWARHCFEQALAILPGHVLASIALASLAGHDVVAHLSMLAPLESHDPIAAAVARAVALALAGRHAEAARVVADALLASDVPGPGAAWIVPVEPILNVGAHRDEWAATLVILEQRAS